MSNSIAPGSSADVNVRVTALTTNPNVPVTYKTIILKKNLVNGVNTLMQEMMSATDTKYVVKYDYTLGEDVTVPANCILEFDGGSISGAYTLTGNNTSIQAGKVCIFYNVDFDGTWNNKSVFMDWFSSKDSNSINRGLAISTNNIIFDGVEYTCTQVLVIQKHNFKIVGNGSNLKFVTSEENNFGEFLMLLKGSNVEVDNLNIESASNGGYSNSSTQYIAGQYICAAYEINGLILRNVNIVANDINLVNSSRLCFDTYRSCDNITLLGCKFVNNAVTKMGGCIWLTDFAASPIACNIVIKDCYMYLKDTQDEIFAVQSIGTDNFTVSIDNCTFVCEDNSYERSHDIYVHAKDFRISNSTMTLNSIVYGIRLLAGDISFENCKITQNGSCNYGIHNTSNGNVIFSGCIYTETDLEQKATPALVNGTFNNCIFDFTIIRWNNGIIQSANINNSVIEVKSGAAVATGGSLVNNTITITDTVTYLIKNCNLNNNTVRINGGKLSNLMSIQDNSNTYIISNNTIIDITGLTPAYTKKGYLGNFSGKLYIYNNIIPSAINSAFTEVSNTGQFYENNNVYDYGAPVIFKKNISKGTTSQRPYLNNYSENYMYYDTDLAKPIWWNGSGWVDATGATV